MFDFYFTSENMNPNNREWLYYMEEFQQILTTFETKIAEIPSELTEKILRKNGVCAIGTNPKTGKPVPFVPAFSGDIDIDGIGTEVTGVTLNGIDIKGKRGEDIAIIWNNSMYMPDSPFLAWYADMFAETDTSIRSNLLMSRLMPIGIAGDEESKKSLEKAYEKVLNGDLYAIALVNKLLTENGFETAEITNTDNITKIQYLSKFYDDLTRRLYVKYGIPISSNAKMAQTNEDELQGYEFYSQIYLNDCFEMRKKGIEEVNRIFGEGTATVALSKPFDRSRDVALKEEATTDVEPVEEPEEATEEPQDAPEEKEKEKDNE